MTTATAYPATGAYLGPDTIYARNVNEALARARRLLVDNGVPARSRGGDVVELPSALVTTLDRPRERVLFDPRRDANPFFHLMESLWMLAGRNDVAWVSQFNRRMHTYSDDGIHLWGAYGARWTRHFRHNQLRRAVETLRENPESRRVVIGMWDPAQDPDVADRGGLDVPCNLSCVLRLHRHAGYPRLDMLVTARSHDILWGLLGANAVHFSYLQEYLACAIGAGGPPVEPGSLVFVSANPHVYRTVWEEMYPGAYKRDGARDPYSLGGAARPYGPLFSDTHGSREDFDADLARFTGPEWLASGYAHPFFFEVAVPLRRAWELRKADPVGAMELVAECAAPDWRLAAAEWLHRRTEVPVPSFPPAGPRHPTTQAE